MLVLKLVFKLCNKNWSKEYNTHWYFKFCTENKFSHLKTEVDKLDIDKLAPVPVGMSKLSDVVKSDVAKQAAYDKLVAKINNIDTSVFILKTKQK